MSDKPKVTLEQVDDLYEFLMGRPPARLGLRLGRGHAPKLRPHAAFAVIWYLQEVLHVLPDHYEACHRCGNLFDTNCSGHLGRKEKHQYCDNCDGD